MTTRPTVLLLLVLAWLFSFQAMASHPDDVKDLPLAPSEHQFYAGTYAVSAPGATEPQMSLRIFEEGGALFGQIGGNKPTRMLYQGDKVLRPEAAIAFVLTFAGEADRATKLTILSPDGLMEGRRVETGKRTPEATEDSSRSGTLYDELARADGLLFDAAFVACDAGRVSELLRDDVEFYHDKAGFRQGAEVREDFERLTKNCPRTQGVARRLALETVQVFPLEGGYAIQMGEHSFVNDTEGSSTAARFVHLWQKIDGNWRLARVLSFDHRPQEPAASR